MTHGRIILLLEAASSSKQGFFCLSLSRVFNLKHRQCSRSVSTTVSTSSMFLISSALYIIRDHGEAHIWLKHMSSNYCGISVTPQIGWSKFQGKYHAWIRGFLNATYFPSVTFSWHSRCTLPLNHVIRILDQTHFALAAYSVSVRIQKGLSRS